jgi:short-subunit dehydrogenase
VYYATKAYVVAFTEALAEELAGSGLRISCLAPGPTATGFAEEAQMTGTRLFRLGTMNAADVARIGYEGWKSGKILVVPGITNRLGIAMVRISPRPVVRKLLKFLNT